MAADGSAMSIAVSPFRLNAEESGSYASELRARDPREATEMLTKAEQLAAIGLLNVHQIGELASFLGANSPAWTRENRSRLRNLLGSQRGAVAAILRTIERAPRAEVLDEAELVLGTMWQPSDQAEMARFFCDTALDLELRTTLLRVLVRLRALHATDLLRNALVDERATIRAAAASMLPNFLVTEARSLLTKRLDIERSTEVREALEDALTELST